MKKILFIILITVLFFSCKKDLSNSFLPDPTLGINDTVWTSKPLTGGFIDSISRAINNTQLIVDSFDVSSDDRFKINSNLELFFSEHSCSLLNTNSSISSGNIKIELLALFKKGDYIKNLISTTSRKYLLQSAGSFFVYLTSNGQEVAMTANKSFTIKWATSSPNTSMNFYQGFPLTNFDSLFTWLQTYNGSITNWDSTSLGSPKHGYQISSQATNWISCSNLIDTSNGTTRLNVTLPLNYTNKNTIIFAAYTDKNTVVRLTTDFSTRSFYSLNVPLNSSITLISISLIDNQFYLGSRTVTVTNANRFSVNPVKSSPAEIISLLDGL